MFEQKATKEEFKDLERKVEDQAKDIARLYKVIDLLIKQISASYLRSSPEVLRPQRKRIYEEELRD